MKFKALPLHVRHTFYYDFRSALLIGAFGGLLMPFIQIVGRKIGASDFQVALLAAGPFVANIFALLWTEDVFGKGRVWYIVWPGIFGRAILLFMLLVTTPGWFTFVIMLYMVVTAIPFPSYASIMKTNYPDAVRGTLMSYIRLGIALVWIAASAFGGWFLERSTFNFRYLFPMAALFGMLSAFSFGAIRIRREKKERGRFVSFEGLLLPLKDGAFRRFLIVFSLFETGLLLALPVYPLVLVDEVRITNLATGVYGSIYSAMWLAGFFFWGRFMDRHPSRTTLAVVFSIACLVPLLYAMTRDVAILAIAQGVWGFVFAAIELIGFVIVTRMAPRQEAARYMGAHIAASGLRGAVFPFIGTALYAWCGAGMVFAIALGLGVAGVLSARAVMPQTR